MPPDLLDSQGSRHRQRRRMARQGLAGAVPIEGALPMRDEQGRDRVPDQVEEHARLRHEAVYAQDQHHAFDRTLAPDGRERGSQNAATFRTADLGPWRDERR